MILEKRKSETKLVGGGEVPWFRVNGIGEIERAILLNDVWHSVVNVLALESCALSSFLKVKLGLVIRRG